MNSKRDAFTSRLGFIMVSAGCAIGIGNVWKFPYVCGANGGAVFVLFYLLFLIIMGIPVMTMEFAVGRASKQSVLEGYKLLEKPGHKWHLHGYFCMMGCYLLMMYYTVVSGWILNYCWKFLSGRFDNVSTDEVGQVFTDMLANPSEMVVFTFITIIVGFVVLSFGVEKGLERVNKFMMTGLLLLIVVLAVHSFTLSGAGQGLKFYLYPNLKKAKEIGLGKVIMSAMNQAFFTLSLGIGSLEIFGSYMSDDNSLAGESIRVCILDTFVALLAGLIIFPACFSFGVMPDQGPSLIFITLPQIFLNMHGSRIWGTLFFVFMTFASFSTITAVFENLVAYLMDNHGMSRKKSITFNLVFILVACVPCILGYNIWSDLHIIGGRDVLDSEDFIVSNLLLPIGALIFLLFCVLKSGWGFDNYLKEANKGDGLKISPKIKPYLLYVLPVLILIIIIQGLV